MDSQSLRRLVLPKVERVIDRAFATVYRMVRRMSHDVKARGDFGKSKLFRRPEARVGRIAFAARNEDRLLVHHGDVRRLDVRFPECENSVEMTPARIFRAISKKRRVKENIPDGEKGNLRNRRIGNRRHFRGTRRDGKIRRRAFHRSLLHDNPFFGIFHRPATSR